jgi:hypothetical protein
MFFMENPVQRMNSVRTMFSWDTEILWVETHTTLLEDAAHRDMSPSRNMRNMRQTWCEASFFVQGWDPHTPRHVHWDMSPWGEASFFEEAWDPHTPRHVPHWDMSPWGEASFFEQGWDPHYLQENILRTGFILRTGLRSTPSLSWYKRTFFARGSFFKQGWVCGCAILCDTSATHI